MPKDKGVVALPWIPGPGRSRLLPSGPPRRRFALADGVPQDVSALSAVLMDAVTGQVICARNADARRPNASTTRL